MSTFTVMTVSRRSTTRTALFPRYTFCTTAMCFDNNNSSLSVHYINAQLTALWQNAQKCAEFLHPGDATVDIRSSHFEKSRYTRALREFYYFGDNPRRQRNSPLEFHATFGKPQIGFICNHDAMLLLDVDAATLNMSGASGQGRDVQYVFSLVANVNLTLDDD